MPYIAVVALDVNNRITKFQEFATQAAADAHVLAVLGTYPLAYAAEKPLSGGPRQWVGNSVAKTLTYSAASVTLADAKTTKLSAAKAMLNTKLALGFTYNTKTYQCDGMHLDNLLRFITAYNYYWLITPTWATTTAYVVGDIRREARVFYKCLVDHTSGVFATDLAANKWAIWYFHPKKDGDGKWRDIVNSMNLLTTEQAKTMCEGGVNYKMSCEAYAVAQKDAINALGTIGAADAYDVSTGWPANT